MKKFKGTIVTDSDLHSINCENFSEIKEFSEDNFIIFSKNNREIYKRIVERYQEVAHEIIDNTDDDLLDELDTELEVAKVLVDKDEELDTVYALTKLYVVLGEVLSECPFENFIYLNRTDIKLHGFEPFELDVYYRINIEFSFI